MQLTTALATFALAVAGVNAAPTNSASLEVRQDPGLIYTRFYAGGGCQEPWLDDVVFVDTSNDCYNNGLQANYGSVSFINNSATRTLKVYSLSGCPTNQGNYFTLAPGQTGCFAQKLGSAKFL